jgi:hypothetical protein
MATMPQTYDLASATYAQPLNTLNALRTGAPMTSGLSPTNYLGAAQAGGQYAGDIYNQQVGSANSANQSTAQMGALALALMMSDRRLKRNIVPLHDTYYGYPLYSFNYVWEDGAEQHIGVMADDVIAHQPEAVYEIGGYMAVDYGALGAH